VSKPSLAYRNVVKTLTQDKGYEACSPGGLLCPLASVLVKQGAACPWVGTKAYSFIFEGKRYRRVLPTWARDSVREFDSAAYWTTPKMWGGFSNNDVLRVVKKHKESVDAAG
jgi:hypothetical protein